MINFPGIETSEECNGSGITDNGHRIFSMTSFVTSPSYGSSESNKKIFSIFVSIINVGNNSYNSFPKW